ncbi:hypothetical protein E2C01_005369 [Portunus trituberculatus]|uniref:Uncharacterized protein n=1 Tax=Portunus trituberculatus TaxID=210409 RepID=A0A5B7CTW0_PORTR|nr:hypothetical protein [Portunus trituberculatus]
MSVPHEHLKMVDVKDLPSLTLLRYAVPCKSWMFYENRDYNAVPGRGYIAFGINSSFNLPTYHQNRPDHMTTTDVAVRQKNNGSSDPTIPPTVKDKFEIMREK